MRFRPLASTLVLLIAASASGADQPRKPNILLIVGDDMGYADVGVHGSKEIPTPHIDSIARAGVHCKSGYVTGPYCSPTRAALLTGRYQQRFGHEFNPGPPAVANAPVGLPLSQTTMAQRLKSAGYATGLVGKWHLGNAEQFHPLNRGFEEFFGFLGGAHAYTPPAPGAAPRGGQAAPGVVRNPILRGHEPVAEPAYLTDALAREATAFVDRHKDRPFFLYLAFNAVHTPLQAPPKYLERFAGITDVRRRTYAAMMSAMGDAVGAVLARVRDAGIEEHTLVFFISDNGGPPANASDNRPLRGHKASTWEGGVRVPFFVQWKGRLPAGKAFEQPVAQIDILPTALAAAGIRTDPEWKLDGVNLLPHFTGQNAAPPHEALYWRFGNQMAVRAGDWKLVAARELAAGGPGAPPRRPAAPAAPAAAPTPGLYNLAADVAEANDLASQQPQKAAELRAAWDKWNADNQPPAWKAPNRAGQRRRQPAAAQQ